MKNLFIAIGSTSTNGMDRLIGYLKECGLFDPTKSDGDVFVTMDTDPRVCQKCLAHNAGNINRVHMINVASEEYDAEHEFIRAGFQGNWQPLAIQPNANGVNGERCKSYSTLKWCADLEAIMDNFLTPGVAYNNARVVLMASAWGGTSSGLYQNISEFVAKKLYAFSGNNAGTVIPFFSLLAMPNLKTQLSGNNTYRGVQNLCYLMRGIQQQAWRYKLNFIPRNYDGDTQKLNFIVPVLSDLNAAGAKTADANGKAKYDISISKYEEARLNGQNSPLPQVGVFVVPTQEGVDDALMISEYAFVLFYLDLVSKIDVNDAGNNRMNPMHDFRTVGGINMAVCKVAVHETLRNFFKVIFNDEWKKFQETEHQASSTEQQQVDKFIKEQVINSDVVAEEFKYMEKFLEKEWLFDAASREELKAVIKDYVKSGYKPYAFPQLNNSADGFFTKFGKYLNDKELTLRASVSDIERAEELCKAVDSAAKAIAALENEKFLNLMRSVCNTREGIKQEMQKIAKIKLREALVQFRDKLLKQRTVSVYKLADTASAKNAVVIEEPYKIAIDSSKPAGFLNVSTSQTLDVHLTNERNRIRTSLKLEDKMFELLRQPNPTAREKYLEGEMLNEAIADLFKIFRQEIDTAQIKLDKVSAVSFDNGSNGMAISGSYPNFRPEAVAQGNIHFYGRSSKDTDENITWNTLKSCGFSSFENFKVHGVSDDTSPFPNNYQRCNNQDIERLEMPENVFGAWIGTLKSNFSLMEILQKSYNNDDRNAIQTMADKIEQNGMRQNLYSLFEQIVFGAVIGILYDKIKEKTSNGDAIRVAIKRPVDGGEVIYEDRWSSACSGDLGLANVDGGCGYKLNTVSTVLLRSLKNWLNRSADKDLDCEQLKLKLTNAEVNVLTNINLSIAPAIITSIRELYTKLENCIEVVNE